MSTLSGRLLNIYEKSSSLSSVIEDTDFLKVCKEFLTNYVRSEPSKYFNPYKFETFSNFNTDLTLEILFSLATNDLVLEKYYAFDCEDCGNTIIEKSMDDIFFCRNIECNYSVPQNGEPLFEFVKENVYYLFSISESIRPLIIKENKKYIPPLSSFPNHFGGKGDKTKVKTLFEIIPLESEVSLTCIENEKMKIKEYSFDLEDAL